MFVIKMMPTELFKDILQGWAMGRTPHSKRRQWDPEG